MSYTMTEGTEGEGLAIEDKGNEAVIRAMNGDEEDEDLLM